MKKAKKKFYKTIYIDKERISHVSKKMRSDRAMQEIVKLFEAIGGPTKADIIFALCFGELCAPEIAAVLDTTRSNISHQLKTLRDLRLVKCKRKGRYVFYSLNEKHIKNMFGAFLMHIKK